ncbi:hypothetical protein BDP55DRAFT_659137 [Colletotrichum godetiae]|uniref:Uncharacterized protein n=1 Tax=Colletotrichum godetiae TaxID=1209918 RepID=A0AAJ0AQ63_9PEZI|nr:uncharacterized protein BDP55DRAFT_659137 [Colletotrichum godetiae]KAK1687698.1 hypothetical protein BDP55DRAFT_659137 [Colletotrichum godetiae]
MLVFTIEEYPVLPHKATWAHFPIPKKASQKVGGDLSYLLLLGPFQLGKGILRLQANQRVSVQIQSISQNNVDPYTTRREFLTWTIIALSGRKPLHRRRTMERREGPGGSCRHADASCPFVKVLAYFEAELRDIGNASSFSPWKLTVCNSVKALSPDRYIDRYIQWHVVSLVQCLGKWAQHHRHLLQDPEPKRTGRWRGFI